jgi:hypothetical protein
MDRARRTVVSGVALPAVLGLLSVAAAAASDVRTDLESLGIALDNAVLQISRPARMGAAPRSAARGYRITGFGAMFVLSPRVLPVPKPRLSAAERDAAHALSEAASALERSLPTGASAEVRQQIQQDARAMRAAEIDLRMREKIARRAAGETEPVAPGAVAEEVPRTLEDDLKELEQDVQTQLRLQAEAARILMGDGLASMPPAARIEYERQMRDLHDQAELFRQRVERRRQMAEEAVLATLGVTPPAAPVPAGAPAGAGTVPVAAAAAPESSPRPAFPVIQRGAPLRPWSLWTMPDAEPAADPAVVIRDVGIVVARVLETQGGRLVQLPPQESVAVAIDFVPATAGSTARPARTLLVRVLKADIDARATGAIDGTEFTKRVEIVEY